MAERIYGVDHGYGHMKTAHSNIVAGVTKCEAELPYEDHVLEYKGRIYEIGSSRLPYMPDKTTSEDYWILTLASLAEEMKARGVHSDQICLAAGLPIKQYGESRDKFSEYLSQEKEVAFKYEGVHYHAKITNVEVTAQGYAALAYHQVNSKKPVAPIAVLVDVGSGTIDISLIKNLKPVADRTYSFPLGINTLYNRVNGALFAKFGSTIEESQIDEIIQGKEVWMSKAYLQVIEKEIIAYAEMVCRKLLDLGFNLEAYPVYWAGGGATLIQRFAKLDPDMNEFVLNPSANAVGYELLVQLKRAQEKAAEKDAAKQPKKKKQQ